MLKKTLEYFGKKIKGPQFEIDGALEISVLLEYSLVRAVAVIRGCILLRRLPRAANLVFAGRGVQLRYRRYISFGRGVSLGDQVMINGLSKKGVQIGSAVTIGRYSVIECTGVISKLGEGVRIGNNSSMGPFSYVGAAGGVVIGENVLMGQKVNFHAENHNFDNLDEPIYKQGTSRKGIVVEDNCWIGASTTFLDGAHVRRGTVVAAGSVVRGDIPENSIIGGVPARVLKRRGEMSAG